MNLSSLNNLPAGAYAIGLSGGADSTALLVLLRERRPDVSLHVVHLNHQTRGKESDSEEMFVCELAKRSGLPCTIARRSEIEPRLENPPRNKSALFRAMRLKLFADTVRQYQLSGVLLAHHADDQAETILHRLLRGSGARGLRGMAIKSSLRVGGNRLFIYRPLLSIEREELREVLQERGQEWCEDSSNKSLQYLRNRLRTILRGQSDLTDALGELGRTCGNLASWVSSHMPELGDSFPVKALWDLPPMLTEAAGRRYLVRCGCPPDELSPKVLRRFIKMANDAASPARWMFPGNVLIRRRGGMIEKKC